MTTLFTVQSEDPNQRINIHAGIVEIILKWTLPTRCTNKQLWLLFSPHKDIRDVFGNKNIVSIRCSGDQTFFNCQLVHLSFTSMWDKASTDSSDCSHSHDQLSRAIAGLAARLGLPQVAEEVEDVVGTVLVWHCGATVGVHVCSQSSCGRNHGCRSGAGGCGGYHH